MSVQTNLGPDYPQEKFFDVVDALEAVAAETGRSVSQVALRWTLQRPTIATLVIGARNEQQLRENLGAVEFELNAAQMAKLDQASEVVPVYPYWHQQQTFLERNPPAVSMPLVRR